MPSNTRDWQPGSRAGRQAQQGNGRQGPCPCPEPAADSTCQLQVQGDVSASWQIARYMQMSKMCTTNDMSKLDIHKVSVLLRPYFVPINHICKCVFVCVTSVSNLSRQPQDWQISTLIAVVRYVQYSFISNLLIKTFVVPQIIQLMKSVLWRQFIWFICLIDEQWIFKINKVLF